MNLALDVILAQAGAVAASNAINAPFASVNGPTSDFFGGSQFEGWSANYASQPTVSTPVAFTVARQGWTATDSASADTTATTAPLDTFYVTTTIRQSWPNNASQSALSAALSDYIYSTDTPSGSATNGSTLVSPKPIARWALPGRRTVGNSVRLEVVAFHRNARAGKQVSHVVFTATDGSHTVTATVATPTILNYTGDQNAVVGYGVDLNVTALNDNASFTVDAVVYPHIGASSASQRRTVDGTAANEWEFATKTFLKSTSKAASPPLVYVISGGTDDVVGTDGKGTVAQVGVQKVSTTAATAKANGFATLKSAVEALKAATTITGGVTDGCEVRISNVTLAVGSGMTAGTYQTASEVVITRDPAVARGSCILSFGATTPNLRQSWVKFKDLTIDRAGGTGQPSMTAPGQLVTENCDFNNSSRASQFIGSATIAQAWVGVAITNGTATLLGASTTPQALVRGCTGSGLTFEGQCIIGNALPVAGSATSATANRRNNSIIAFNKFNSLDISGGPAFGGFDSNDIDGLAFCQNLLEPTGTTSNPQFRPSGDDAASNLTHVVVHNNTFAGGGDNGRLNMFYNETNNTLRTQKFISFKGNIEGAGYYLKTDWFHGANDGNVEGFTVGSPSTFIGNWAMYYGAGCQGNFSQYNTPSDTIEALVFAGRGSLIGTNFNTPQITFANLFTANAAVTWNGTIYTAGAGNGTYTLTNTGANTAKGIVEVGLFAYTLDGVARALTADHPGALSAA